VRELRVTTSLVYYQYYRSSAGAVCVKKTWKKNRKKKTWKIRADRRCTAEPRHCSPRSLATTARAIGAPAAAAECAHRHDAHVNLGRRVYMCAISRSSKDWSFLQRAPAFASLGLVVVEY
jgi:hypothetical protein